MDRKLLTREVMNVYLMRIARLVEHLFATVVACVLVSASGFGQAIGNSWEGIRGPTVGVPPDTHGAPGPNGVVATVNLSISYFTKSGSLVWGPVALPATFFPANTGVGFQNSDPVVVFDQDSRRFFVAMQEDHDSRLWINVAVSKNSDPRTSGSADWVTYRVDGTQYAGSNSAGGVNYGGDYPGLAVDAQALYVTYNLYGFLPDGTMSGCGCNANGAQLTILNKSQLVNGVGVNYWEVAQPGQNLKPVTPLGGSPGNVMYLAQLWNQTTVKIIAVSDPLGTRMVSSQFLTVTDFGGGTTNGAPQLGSASTIDPINGRTLGNATLVGGDVWFCATRGQPGGPAVAAFYRLRLNGWPSSGSVSVVESSTVGDGSYWNYCPAIGANVAGDVAMTWTRSSSSTYTTMMYAYRNAADSSFGAPQVVKASNTANNDGRWGDYATVWPDPNDGSLWIAHEWTRSDTGTWSTWWAQVLTPAEDIYVNWNAPFPFIQNGSLAYPYTTVGAAYANITHGTIHIYGGQNYNEQFTINKSVVLQLYSGSPFAIGIP
jgi:hypothetical protein